MKKPSRPLRKKKLLTLAALALAAMLSVLSSYLCISVTRYTFETEKLTQPLRVVQLSDLHDNGLLLWQDRLLKKVEELQPDLVLITGDAVNYYTHQTSRLEAFLTSLTHLAPVYFATGNHELGLIHTDGNEQLFQTLKQTGVQVLNDDYADVECKGQRLRLGGLYGNVGNLWSLPQEEYRAGDLYRFLAAYEDTDRLKLLLAHRPEDLIDPNGEARWDIDLAFCGHEHGGQVRLPFLGGFYSSHLGWFTPYLEGAKRIGGVPAVISRGLGSYVWKSKGIMIPPRFWNPPEIVAVDLLPKGS